ncbi:UNVERIFIED_CONTAM: hypothetical protein Slati_0917200 [Sesamum latifolium]|uniref:Uncharacterized protein n=1 Tax=Sesamum latifolium TaxID=2727402 RepID=A0AAW2XQA4_9LAMI
MEKKELQHFQKFSPHAGSSVSLGPEEEGGVPSSTAAEAGGSLEGPSEGSTGAFSFFPSGFPSLGAPPYMESVAAGGGGNVSLLPLPLQGGYRDRSLTRGTK